MMKKYTGIKFPPLTPKEIEEKYKETQSEMAEVLEWKKEEKKRLVSKNSKPQAKGVAKRALVRVQRRIDTVNGNILYWKLRNEGKSHFYAGLERSEYWDKLKKKDSGDSEEKKEEED